ncbi:MAG TPA: ATP-binding protein [Thermomicrobiales bacterium]|nr:ATP-binding protein [Thermomicrobiales bacterium]
MSRQLAAVTAGFAAAIVINFLLLPGNHIVSSLYLLPVLMASHWWRARPVAATATVAAGLYLASAMIEGRPLGVWPFGLLGMLIGGYLTVRFAIQREEIARLARREAEDRTRFRVFIGMVVHDLAGAVNNVQAGLEMLSWSNTLRSTSEEEQVATQAVNGGVSQMSRLLDDLRDAAAIGADRFVVRPVPMDLVEVVREVVDRQRLSAGSRRLALDAPDRLDGAWDRDRIGQLLGNLVSNACKYSPAGGEVTVRVGASSGRVVVSVTDDGPGIEPDQQERIFEPFARLETHHDLPGTGLGLWIARAIVDAHGGHIRVEGAPGLGTTFTVDLPLTPVATARRDHPAPTASPMAADTSTPPQPSAPGPSHPVAAAARSMNSVRSGYLPHGTLDHRLTPSRRIP